MADDDDLRRQLAYYKRTLDELAAQRIAIEHNLWALNYQLRQKTQGFQLLSRLALAFGAQTEVEATFRITALALNAALQVDRTAIFVPGPRPGTYVAAHLAGLSEAAAARVGAMVFEVPDEIATSRGFVIAAGASDDRALVTRLRDAFGIDSFVLVPVPGDRTPLGLVFSGRLGGHTSLLRTLDPFDLDTFRAIAGVLEAVAQNTRLARLEQTERLKTEFYAEIAHELRTPLTLTLGPLAQILEGKWGELAAPVREHLEVVERNQARLLGLINQILELARMEAGATELRLDRIADANVLVADCAAQFRPAAEARGLELVTELAPAVASHEVVADREQLERAVFNLLSNALKFTDRGTVTVATAIAGDELVITVADSGIGIPAGELAHVFDRFRRVAQRDRQASSSGIGLAVVKRIAELHGGRVSATSTEGQGARFTLVIPVRGKPAVTPARAIATVDVDTANARAEARFDPSRPTLLYVEDDAELRDHVRASLADAYNLFEAADGADGLVKARAYQPDLIVTDQLMPRMDGRQLLAALRADPDLRAVPVVFLTAQYGAEGRISSLAAGADDYLAKPFHDAELRARIANLIAARSYERELAELNRRLELQVRDQMSALVQAGELERFLPRAALASLHRGADGARPAPVRRQLTVLVTELSAFAALGERLDEPEVATIVDEYLGAVSAICAARGGVVDGMTGGRISVLFGVTGEANPGDAAAAAVHAATEIRQRAIALDADARRRGLAGDSRRGIGIATGPCVIGAFGSDIRAFTAIGPAVRVAARLQAETAARMIVCDSVTRELLGTRVQTRSLAGEAHEVLAAASVTAVPARPRPVAGSAQRVFRREGDYWTIIYNGRISHVASSKGTTYLAYLLDRPHVEVHVLELVSAGASEAPLRRVVSASEIDALGLSIAAADPATPILDRSARLAYRDKLRDLDEQIELATSSGDSERITRLGEARSALADQVAAALGLHGRDRNTSQAAERVRVNIARTVKSVIRKLRDSDPVLGRHLATSLRTGMYCAYAPPPGIPDAWLVES